MFPNADITLTRPPRWTRVLLRLSSRYSPRISAIEKPIKDPSLSTVNSLDYSSLPIRPAFENKALELFLNPKLFKLSSILFERFNHAYGSKSEGLKVIASSSSAATVANRMGGAPP